MPDNKKPIIRYSVIDQCIRNTARDYTLMDLMESVNESLIYRGLEPVKSRTTVYNDLTDMELDFQAPIEKVQKGGKVIYKYSNQDYSFGNQPLNMDEIEHLKDAVLILSRFSGLPGFEWIDELVSKLEIGTYEEAGDPNVVSFESNEFLKGKEHIGPLFKAIIKKRVLEIRYRKFESEEEKTHLIHPYHIKEFDNRWYVFGHLPKHDVLIPLALDRIIDISVLDGVEFIENKKYDFTEYFEDIIGIRKEDNTTPIRIKLKFSPLMSEYVATKPLHGSQKKVSLDDNGSLIISIEVIPNFELENLIFTFKDEVEVLEPDSLRNRVKEIIKAMMAKYQ
ncbi:MAG: WYL domain-containing protein [Fulvivirga sp.]|uniref:helix-turn-helix transcriptional regulator n=1 Tax=Fulvivirga sp. TaxID=1931237 RepID=UPI0032EECCE1